MKTLLLSTLLALTCYAAPPLFLLQNGASVPGMSDAILDLSGTTLTSGNISAWASIVGSYSADQVTTAKQPVVSTAFLGGIKTASFDQVDDVISVASFAPGSPTLTIIIAAYWSANASNFQMVNETSASYDLSNNTFAIYNDNVSQQLIAGIHGVGAGASTFSLSQTTVNVFNNAAHVVSIVLDTTLSSNEVSIWVDGVASNNRTLNNNQSGSFSTQTLYVGGRLVTLPSGVKLWRNLVFPSGISTARRQSIEKYLGGQIGVTITH